MATFKEALTTSLTNFAKSIAKTYPKTANIVDNLLSTDSTLPLSAKQGNVLQKQIDTLNSNIEVVECTITDKHSLWKTIADNKRPSIHIFFTYSGSDGFLEQSNYMLQCAFCNGNCCGTIIDHWNIENSYILIGNTYELDNIVLKKIT